MLIGIYTKTEPEEKIEEAKKLASSIDGKTRIFYPRDAESYVRTLKEHKPGKENLILINTHLDLRKEFSEAAYRIIDSYFDLKSGSLWGNEPEPLSTGAYVGPLSTDASTIIDTAVYNEGRSQFVRKLSTDYIGRASADPHTLLIGYKVRPASVSVAANYLIRSLPEAHHIPSIDPFTMNQGRLSLDIPWWSGVAYIDASEKAMKAIEWFEDASIITLGDTAHEALTSRDIDHAASKSTGMLPHPQPSFFMASSRRC